MKLLLLSAAVLLGALPVLASLGDTVDSVATDQRMLRAGTHTVNQGSGYSVHELKSNNVAVKEYVSPAGKVFAVTWKGSAMPDLSQLFGSYFAEYHAKVPARARHQMTLRGGDLVVEGVGHQRFFTGRAYVPSLVPAGLNPEVIQ